MCKESAETTTTTTTTKTTTKQQHSAAMLAQVLLLPTVKLESGAKGTISSHIHPVLRASDLVFDERENGNDCWSMVSAVSGSPVVSGSLGVRSM